MNTIEVTVTVDAEDRDTLIAKFNSYVLMLEDADVKANYEFQDTRGRRILFKFYLPAKGTFGGLILGLIDQIEGKLKGTIKIGQIEAKLDGEKITLVLLGANLSNYKRTVRI